MSKPFAILPLAITLVAATGSMGADPEPVTTVFYDPNEVRPYVSYLKDHAKPPVDYVLKLFESYDLVILAERTHPETTQWDFIRDLTADPRFIEQVGHVFTEYGSVSQQQSLEQLMATRDLGEEEVGRRVIAILRNFPIHPHGWHNNNFFDYLKNLYELNQSLAVDERIKLFFSDVSWQWQGKTKEDHDLFWKTQIPKRDQIMANRIASKFREILASDSKRKKALVIMNTRHAYRTGGKSIADYLFGNSTAECLFREFPKTTANVMLNTKAAYFKGVSERSMTSVPIQDGKWDAAFWILGDPPSGYDFKDSPFGKDRFDLHSAFTLLGDLKYEDVFTGMIFYQPLGSHLVASDIPGYYDEEFKETVLRRAKLGEERDYSRIARFLQSVETDADLLKKGKERTAQRRWHRLEFKIASRPIQPPTQLGDKQAPVESSQPVKVHPAPGERLPSGKEIIERSIQAMGGRDVLAGIESRVTRGSIEIMPMGVKSTITAYQVRPNKYYARIVTQIDATEMTTEQCTDGDVAWEVNSLTGPRILEGQEKALMVQQSVFDETGYRQLYRRIECVGMEQVQGTVCYKVIQTPKKGEPFTVYYSRQSGLPVKSSFTVEDQSGVTQIENLQSDYRKVGGVLYPHRHVQKAMNVEFHLRVQSIEDNAAIPEDRFAPPEAVKQILQQAKGTGENAGQGPD
jgi:hypothetical protein